ncbi:hypothetical protein ACHAW6_001407 [Cyclotella cf. meneghiniana]
MNGTAFYRKPSFLQTSFETQMLRQRPLPMHTTMAHSTMTGCHLHHLGAWYSSMSNLVFVAPGASIPPMDGTLAPHLNTITHIAFLSRLNARTVYLTPCTSNRNTLCNPQLPQLMQLGRLSTTLWSLSKGQTTSKANKTWMHLPNYNTPSHHHPDLLTPHPHP